MDLLCLLRMTTVLKHRPDEQRILAVCQTLKTYYMDNTDKPFEAPDSGGVTDAEDLIQISHSKRRRLPAA